MKWISVDSKKLVCLEKDVKTFMITKTMNIGKRIQEEIVEVKRTRKDKKAKMKHSCLDLLLTKLI
jgi:hypothetical protein